MRTRRGIVREQAELIENQTSRARWRLHNCCVDGRTRHRRQVAVGAPAVAHIVHAKTNVEVRKQIERVAQVPLDARVEVTAGRTVECRVLAETSEAVENRDRAHRIVQRIVRRSARIARDNRHQIRVAIHGSDHVNPVRTGHRRPKISRRVKVSLRDAMNRCPEAYRVIHFVNRAAVVTPEKIALNGLSRTRHAWPQLIRANLHVERRRRRIFRVRIDRIDHLLIAEARAMHESSAVPIEAEHRSRNVQLIAKIRLAVRRPNFVRIVVAEPSE